MAQPVLYPSRRHRRARAGWTLIEVIVATSIMATLAGAAVAVFSAQIRSAQKNQCKSNLQIIESAKNAWVSDHPGQALPATSPAAQTALNNYIRGYKFPVCPLYKVGVSGSDYTLYNDITQATHCPNFNQSAY